MINNDGLAIVMSSEGYKGKSYLCPAGIWTIGYGTTRVNWRPVTDGMTCTLDEATKWLIDDLSDAEGYVNIFVKVPLNDNQRSALISICYNTGPGAKGVKDGVFVLKSGEPSTLLKKLNSGDYQGAADQFLLWRKAAGKIMNGLVKRREKERALFLKEV